MNQRTFGRRPGAQPTPRRAQPQAEAPEAPAKGGFDNVPVERVSPPPTNTDFPSLEHELREWNAARKQAFKIPWRQLSLMASLCFGIASFVLPESTNDSVQWVLYALMAASLYAGFSKRRKTD